MQNHNTHMRKGHDGWEAKTEIVLPGITRTDHTGECQAILSVRTGKASRGGLYTSATVSFKSGLFMSHMLYQDFSERVAMEPGTRCTEKAVERLHDSVLANIESIVIAANAHYAKEEA